MKYTKLFLLLSAIGCMILGGCNSESDSEKKPSQKVILGKLELSGGWARPGSKGGTSGVYLTIANGTASDDTLMSISSNMAKKVELHESVENEDGTMSMRPAGTQVIKESEKLYLQPGGLHIMLMNLTQDVAVGDSLTLSLDFARVGTKSISVPVKIQN